MKVTLEQVGNQGTQIITIEHDKGTAWHTPDLIEFAKYCEDILHKAKSRLGGFSVKVLVKSGISEFFAYINGEAVAYALYNYFSGGKYEVDMGYDEEKRHFFVLGNAKT